ncbi:MAG: ATP-binding protein [Pseudohongiellaceae bacterium]
MNRANPFTPGYGLTPPHLAGRGEQQALLAHRVDAMNTGKSVNSVVMYGPRGMGKTVLLAWLEEYCQKAKVKPLTTTPSVALKSTDDLARVLLPPSWLPDEFRVATGGWLKMEMSWVNPKTKKQGTLEEHLVAACKNQPRALLVDEAHDPVNPENYKEFLQMAQTVARKAPFLLVLAGTPGLEQLLRTVGATFIERGERIGIGLLDEASAAEAIRVPLQSHDISIQDKALSHVIHHAQCYPFFLQQWGEALYAQTEESGTTALTQQDAATLEADVQTKRVGFYDSRYEALDDSPELLSAAHAVARAFKSQESLDRPTLNRVIEDSLNNRLSDPTSRTAKAQELTKELNRIDFVWKPPNSSKMVPGIPSFMNYVQDNYSGLS